MMPELDTTWEPVARRRVLFICYLFPPVGGAGVQRPVKFVKYLHQFGWDVTVLTVENPSVPVFDESLLDDVPRQTVIRKASTLEPGYRHKARIARPEGVARSDVSGSARNSLLRGIKGALRGVAGVVLQPDPQILWFPAAASRALELLRATPHDIIFATAPPYSSFLLGSWLKRRVGLPLVLDYRDEWDLSSAYRENSKRDAISLFIQRRMQRSVLRAADGLVATTKASTEAIAQRAKRFGVDLPGICIYNGFDEADMECIQADNVSTLRHGGRLRMVYTGTLWNLTSVEPLVKAVKMLSRQDPGLMERLDLVFVGRKISHQLSLLEQLSSTGCRLELRDYCDHREALSVMESADVLCLLLSDVSGAERVVPAKLFEYLAMRREILAIMPKGESADIVTRYFPDSHFGVNNISGIADWIKERIERKGSGRLPSVADIGDISSFSRRCQAKQLSEYLNRFVPQAPERMPKRFRYG
ncbi:MAG TPA: hypothetical protein ENJ43_05845 [Gammaproteobacteria bacterium]|nr:hypothetical protein [Gammaproteobacteria bacterium]